MARLHAALGSTAVYFQKRVEIAQTSAIPRTCSVMAGDSPGQTIAESFTTGLRRVRTENPGASARSWCGGIRKRKNGLGSIFLIIKKTLPPLLLRSSTAEWG